MNRPHGYYDRYLRSSHWRHTRERYRSERPWECGICTSTERLELHHKTYEHIWAERLDDLVPLCQRCHSLLHQLVREGQATLDPASAFKRPVAEKVVAHGPKRAKLQKKKRPISKKEMAYIRRLGGDPPADITHAQAGRLIARLQSKKDTARRARLAA